MIERLRRPSLHLVLTAAILAAAVALRIFDPNPVARLRFSIFDSYLNLKPREADRAFPVRIVDVDEASLAAIGQWPWPRSEIARIIERLTEAGAEIVGAPTLVGAAVVLADVQGQFRALAAATGTPLPIPLPSTTMSGSRP